MNTFNRKNKKAKVLGIVFFVIAIVIAIIDLFPFLWSAYSSFRPTSEVYNFTLNFSNLTFDAYKHIFESFPILTWYKNSVIIAFVVTFGNVLVNAAAGYALARFNFPGKNLIFLTILGVMMIPGQVILIPTYMMISKLNWVNTYVGLTLPFLFSAFNVFMMRQFFLSFPKELEEAALIDGLSRIGTFFKVALPLASAPLTTLTILSFMGNWNSFLYPSILTSTMDMYTLPVGLSLLQGQYFAFPNQVMTGAMLTTIPMIIVYIIFQKRFVGGLVDSGVKG